MYSLYVGGVDGSWVRGCHSVIYQFDAYVTTISPSLSQEFLVVGEPFLQLETSVDASKTGEVVVSSKCWELIKSSCHGEPRGSDWLVTEVHSPIPIQSVDKLAVDVNAIPALRCYIPKGVQVRLDSHQSAWLAELRRVTVLFVKLNSLTYSSGREFNWLAVHEVLCFMQSVIFRYEGMVRQFLVDDKGTVLVRLGPCANTTLYSMILTRVRWHDPSLYRVADCGFRSSTILARGRYRSWLEDRHRDSPDSQRPSDGQLDRYHVRAMESIFAA